MQEYLEFATEELAEARSRAVRVDVLGRAVGRDEVTVRQFPVYLHPNQGRLGNKACFGVQVEGNWRSRLTVGERALLRSGEDLESDGWFPQRTA